MIPCYVSGKGMHATEKTWDFKVAVMRLLETTGLGYDTRHHYYRKQYPDMPAVEFARMICDPVEYYDKDWPAFQAAQKRPVDADRLITRFMLERDQKFRREARVALVCFDEAGFGTGVNVMRFLSMGKRVLGFINPDSRAAAVNPVNMIALSHEYPELFTLVRYRQQDEIAPTVVTWLERQNRRTG